jgi:predicted PhzF superfamily epimerase YddE/YHI9
MERLEPKRRTVVFHSVSRPLLVKRVDAGYLMDLPIRRFEPAATAPRLAEALGVAPLEVSISAFNYMVPLDSAKTLRKFTPDMAALARLDRSGVVGTAPGEEGYDFVSRYFAPAKGIPEGPVTGAAHCILAPFWANRLGKLKLRAYQASPRGGEVNCRLVADRIELQGSCVFYLEGTVEF